MRRNVRARGSKAKGSGVVHQRDIAEALEEHQEKLREISQLERGMRFDGFKPSAKEDDKLSTFSGVSAEPAMTFRSAASGRDLVKTQLGKLTESTELTAVSAKQIAARAQRGAARTVLYQLLRQTVKLWGVDQCVPIPYDYDGKRT